MSNRTRNVPETTWLTWADSPWMDAAQASEFSFDLTDRLMRTALAKVDERDFLARHLPEVASEFRGQGAALLRKSPLWVRAGEFGRLPSSLPVEFVEETLDREAAGFRSDGEDHWIAAPIPRLDATSDVLLLRGRDLQSDALAAALAVARVLGRVLDALGARSWRDRQIERLRTTLEIARRMALVRETTSLLELIAHEATRLIECDRASIFVWAPDRNELVACPALGVEGGTLRVPDDVGLVGEVIRTGKTIVVDDAYQDPRFNQEVDRQTGYRTRSILCEPLRDAEGRLLGAFQAINKRDDGTFDKDDQNSLRLLAEQAAIAIQNTQEHEQLVRSRDQLTEQVTRGVRIIGNSPPIAALRNTIARLANTDLPVLVLGESGTGKEVVSQSLHFQGSRADKPFVAVNCAALTETLLESELFGHEAGAFTDARDARPGKFELADGGTLFLDEIGDMSAGGQAKLLRVLEQKVVTRVGGSQTIPIDVRIVAATNAKLAELVRERQFREDLYFRLTVVTLDIPPLRDRPEDVLPLAEHFLEKFCEQAKRRPLKLAADARRRLQAHHWPGNVRELRNLMERVAFLTSGNTVQAEDLAFILNPSQDLSIEPSADLGLTDATKEFQRQFIRKAVKRVSGNMSEAARLLGLHRSNLYRKMRHLDMEDLEEA